jgi:hypothetical protein
MTYGFWVGVAGVGLAASIGVEATPSPCLTYEPDTIRVQGHLERRIDPGRPDYESTASGDEAEAHFYLRLQAPVCIEVGQDSLIDVAQSDISDVQLVLDSAGYARLRPQLGSQVQLSGQLMAAHTGHHHAPLLLNVIWPAAK